MGEQNNQTLFTFPIFDVDRKMLRKNRREKVTFLITNENVKRTKTEKSKIIETKSTKSNVKFPWDYNNLFHIVTFSFSMVFAFTIFLSR